MSESQIHYLQELASTGDIYTESGDGYLIVLCAGIRHYDNYDDALEFIQYQLS